MASPRKHVTLRDIADATLTSPSTVSLALRGDTRISEPVREKIVKAAQEMGYQPNLIGSLLRTSSPKIIGVVADLSQELHAAYVREMSSYAREIGYSLLTMSTNGFENEEEAYKAALRMGLSTFIVINPSSAALRHSGLNPRVVIGQKYADIPSLSHSDYDVITSDNTQGMAGLMEYLFKLGHRHIVYFDGPAGASGQARRESMEEAAARVGIKVDIRPAGSTLDAGYESATALLADVHAENTSAHTRPSAIVCYNDHCAQGVQMALWKAGVRVPEEISVTGYDNSPVAASAACSLTSVDRSCSELARVALDRARGWNEGEIGQGEHMFVQTEVVIRSSCGEPWARFQQGNGPG